MFKIGPRANERRLKCIGSNIGAFFSDEFGNDRTTIIDGEPYLVGKDVAEILGYKNPQKAIRDHVDEEDKTLNESFTVNGTKAILINESGFYSLVFSSKLPTARKFKHWVTSEVLPKLRIDGYYAVKKPSNRELAKLYGDLADAEDRVKFLELESEEQKRQVAEMLVNSEGTFRTTTIANKCIGYFPASSKYAFVNCWCFFRYKFEMYYFQDICCDNISK